MKLFKLSQDKNNDYDTYDCCLVAAKSEDEARLIHPYYETDWNGKADRYDTWVDADDVTVECIADTCIYTESKVVIASFNAG